MPTQRLIALTGERVLKSVIRSSKELSAPAHAFPRKRARTNNTTQIAASAPDEPQAASGAWVSAGECPGVTLMLAVLRGAAPARLAITEALALAECCSFHMATSVLKALPAYIEPLIDNAPLQAVRLRSTRFRRVQSPHNCKHTQLLNMSCALA